MPQSLIRSSDGIPPTTAGDAGAASSSRGRRRGWIAVAIVLAVLLFLAALWRFLPGDVDVQTIVAAIEPHREAWYAVPATLLGFIVLSFLMLSVLGMTLVVGMVFGPWLGAVVALAGCLASAAAGFWTGRWLGRDTVERLGNRVRKLSRSLGDNGILAAFLLRKIPAPFTLVNIIAGSSRIRFLDFMIGTLLGMGTIVFLLSFFGHQIGEGLQGRRPTMLALALAVVLLVVVIMVNRMVKKRRTDQ